MPRVPFVVDYAQAFDSLSISSTLKTLENQGIHAGYILLLCNIYKDATASVMLHKETNKVNTEKGVRQGVSPIIFTAEIEEVFKTLEWEEKGLQRNGQYISHLHSTE